MQNNTFMPLALILIVGLSFYFIYGYLSPASVDLNKYQILCEKYQADADRYSVDEKQMLVNEIGFLLPDEIPNLKSAQERQLKQCAIDLATQLDAKK